MPRLTDKDAIRAILRRDPVWSVFALGDLAPHMFDKTEWFTPDLSLVFQDFGTSILFAVGTGSVREALDHVTFPVRLQVQEDAFAEVTRHATITTTRSMWRMGWNGGMPQSTRPAAARLGPQDLPALEISTLGGIAGDVDWVAP